MAESANAGIADYCESAAQFAPKRKQYLLEYTIVTDLSNLDTLGDEEKELALEYFDVYGKQKSQRIERSVGFVCYPESKFSNKLPKGDTTTPKQHEDFFSSEYSKRHPELQKVFDGALKKHGLSNSDCRVWLIAVPDKNLLRKLFAEGIAA